MVNGLDIIFQWNLLPNSGWNEMNDNYVNANVHKTMFSIIKKNYPITFPFFANKALGESHSSLNYFWK
jgi:hypothetical protein